jgi:hypothetical protein
VWFWFRRSRPAILTGRVSMIRLRSAAEAFWF